MSFTLSFNDTCPKCHKPIMQAVIESRPSNRDLALQNFECADCGLVKTRILSLRPGAKTPELAA
jgi:uncharacterized Zn finger protein